MRCLTEIFAADLASHAVGTSHRRRIKTEEKGKVVAVVWGTYLYAALTI